MQEPYLFSVLSFKIFDVNFACSWHKTQKVRSLRNDFTDTRFSPKVMYVFRCKFLSDWSRVIFRFIADRQRLSAIVVFSIKRRTLPRFPLRSSLLSLEIQIDDIMSASWKTTPWLMQSAHAYPSVLSPVRIRSFCFPRRALSTLSHRFTRVRCVVLV